MRSWVSYVVVAVVMSSATVGGFVFFRALAKSMAVDDYVETRGVVTVSEMRRTSRSTRLVLVARYEAGTRSFHVNETHGTPEGLDADDVLARYPVGSTVTVYYDPEDPADAVFTRDVAVVKWLALFVVTLAMAVAVLWVFVTRRRRRAT